MIVCKLLYAFDAYSSSFTGGVDVTAQAATETSPGRVVTGAGPGGGPQVRIFSESGYNVGSFYAYDQTFHGGVRVSLSDGTLLTAPWSDGGLRYGALTNLV